MRSLPRFAVAAAAVTCLCVPLAANAGKTVANVSGAYAFRFAGTDYAVTGRQIVATGVFTADGQGGISAGSITYNDGGDVCTSTTLVTDGSSYTVVADGEGTLKLEFSTYSGTCPLQGTFSFATAIALLKSSVEQHLELSSTVFPASDGQTTQAIPVAGLAEHE